MVELFPKIWLAASFFNGFVNGMVWYKKGEKKMVCLVFAFVLTYLFIYCVLETHCRAPFGDEKVENSAIFVYSN